MLLCEWWMNLWDQHDLGGTRRRNCKLDYLDVFQSCDIYRCLFTKITVEQQLCSIRVDPSTRQKLIQQASRVHLLPSFHPTKNSLHIINMRFFELATALAAAGTVSAAPMEKRAAAVDELVGFAAGTTGGGSGAGTTVSDCAGLTAAAKNGGVIKIKGTLTGCGIVKIVSNTSVLGVGSSAGLTDGGFQVRKADNVIIRNLKVRGAFYQWSFLSDLQGLLTNSLALQSSQRQRSHRHRRLDPRLGGPQRLLLRRSHRRQRHLRRSSWYLSPSP